MIVPARGGSKGIPGKNIKHLGGKPLIQYTIEVAREVFKDTSILVSTDDEEIRQCAMDLGLHVPFLRPAALATDEAGSHEVVMHALDYAESQGGKYDSVVLLQPTSPFRAAHDIRNAMAKFKQGHEMVVTVRPARSSPHFYFKEENNYLVPLLEREKATRRQDFQPVWELNGAIYIMGTEALRKKGLHALKKVKSEMEESRSIDLDTPLDWAFAEFLLAQGLV